MGHSAEEPELEPPVFAPIALQAPICWHWRQGRACPAGDACRFRHTSLLLPPPEVVPRGRTYRLLRKNWAEHEFELLERTLQEHGFFPSSGAEPPALLWVASAQRPAIGFGPDTRVNRLGCRCSLTHKHELQRTLRAAGTTALAPETYILPAEQEDLEKAMAHAQGRWVVKPLRSGCGAGISFTTSPLHVAKEPCVVCAYVEDPLVLPFPLIPSAHGNTEYFKVDLRIYVLVTCLDPVEAYIHEQGLVRYAAAPYSSNESTLSDCRIHLTYIRAHDKGLYARTRHRNCKLAELREYIRSTRGEEADLRMWNELRIAVWKTLQSAPAVPQPRLSCPRKGLLDFEFFGFDVLLDDQLRPWILEVNSQPNLSSSGREGGKCYEADHAVKSIVVADLLTIAWLPQGCNEPRRGGLGFLRLP